MASVVTTLPSHGRGVTPPPGYITGGELARRLGLVAAQLKRLVDAEIARPLKAQPGSGRTMLFPESEEQRLREWAIEVRGHLDALHALGCRFDMGGLTLPKQDGESD